MPHLDLSLAGVPNTGSAVGWTGLPLGICVSPLNDGIQPGQDAPDASTIARCAKCGAYICPQVSLDAMGWMCALCDTLNPYSRQLNWRYMPGNQEGTRRPAELVRDAVDVVVTTGQDAVAFDCRPMLVYILDVGGPSAAVSACCLAILRSLEVLPAQTLVSLITYNKPEEVVIYRAQSDLRTKVVPSLLHELILPAGDDQIPSDWLLSLEDPTTKSALMDTVEGLISHAEDQVLPCDMGQVLQVAFNFLGGAAAAQIASARCADPNVFLACRLSPLICSRMFVFQSRLPTAGTGAVIALLPSEDDEKRFSQVSTERQVSGVMDSGHSELTSMWQDAPSGADNPSKMKSVPESVPLAQQLRDQAKDQGRELGFVPSASTVYSSIGLTAADLGMVLDLFCFGAQHLGVKAVHGAATASGGALFLYRNEKTASRLLTQDVCKRAILPMAVDCLLRIRCSWPALIDRAVHPSLTPVGRESDGLWRAPACHPHSAWAIQLGVADAWREKGAGCVPVVVQMALQYLCIVVLPDGRPSQLRRRLRISTTTSPAQKLPIAEDVPSELERTFDPGVTTLLLTQHALFSLDVLDAASVAASTADWLLGLVKRLHGIDLAAASAQLPGNVRSLLRAMHSLLRVMLVSVEDRTIRYNAADNDDDERVARRIVLGSLSPTDLMTALYPTLSSWQSCERRSFIASHTLSKSTLRLVDARYLLLGAFQTIIVAHLDKSPTGNESGNEEPWPPPRGSLLRRAAEESAARRVPTPELCLVPAERAALDYLEPYLFDDLGIRYSSLRELKGAIDSSQWSTEDLAASCHVSFLQALDALADLS